MKAIVFNNYDEKFDQLNKHLKIDKIDFEFIRFNNGEGKVVVKEDVENEDIIIFSDFNNTKIEKSKDECYVNLKRLISALDDARSISVFLPLIYQSRQNANKKLESKDFLMFVNDLKNIGVKNILTFELHGDHDDVISYSLSKIFKNYNYDVVVSPDDGGVSRSKEYSKVLNCDNRHFSKVRDLNKLVNGSNPIKEYININYDFKGKNVVIVDDILDSGSTLINALNNINDANKVDIFVAYPLFSSGVKKFKKMVKLNKLNKIYVSNLIYLDKKVLKNKFIEVIDVNEVISECIKEVIK